MTRDEEILTACKGFLKRYPNIEQAGLSIGFLDGAVWADEHPINVWHDASEEPKDDLGKDDSVIIYQDKYGNCRFITKRDIVILHINWECFATVNVRCWAYISDLLPKGGEL